jgi:rod shape-determining protein MreB
LIDLGTANTLIIHNDKVIDSPSIVARDRISGKIIAVKANLMQEKHMKTLRP